MTGRLIAKSRTHVEENASGGSVTYVWHGRPAGTIRLFNTRDWMENTHSVYGVVLDAGDGGAVDSGFDSVDPA